jgi:Mn2+/Fe2+ NRAMP family transporter
MAGAVAQPAQSAVLLGAAAGMRGTPIAGDLDASAVRDRVRESLGADGFERAYGAGLGMSAQKALTTAGLADVTGSAADHPPSPSPAPSPLA